MMMEMGKGISAVIATILLLLITVALAGTAYMYISGMLTGKIAKVVSILDASCSGTDPFDITLVLSNDGTEDIVSDDMTILVNNDPTDFTYTPDLPLTPRKTTVANSTVTGISGANTVLVVTPSGSEKVTVYC